MGFQFRKRIQLLSGLYVNFGKTGTSFSIGRAGVRINIGGKRGPSASIGIPGSGISHTTKLSINSPAPPAHRLHKEQTEGIGFFRLLGYGILLLFVFLLLRGLLLGD